LARVAENKVAAALAANINAAIGKGSSAKGANYESLGHQSRYVAE